MNVYNNMYVWMDLLLDKLQRGQNEAARVVMKASCYDHVTQILETPLAPRAISHSV